MLIVNKHARIGKWCDINQGVNIGANGMIDEDGKVHLRTPIIGEMLAISTPEFEEAFLKKYPQYRELIKTIQ